MFDISYPCKFIQFKNINDGVHIRTHVYTFKAKNGFRYIVEFDEFVGNVFLIKFYQKNHSKSPNKYNILTNSGWSCSVIYTVFDLMVKIWSSRSFGNVSFAFMGSNTIFPDGKKESRNETKRFTVYKRLIATFIGDKSFDFQQNVDASIFVLLNKRNLVVDTYLEKILKYIYVNYAILEIDLILEPVNIFDSQTG